MTIHRIVLALVALGATAAPVAVGAQTGPSESANPALRWAEPQLSGWRYSIGHLTDCEFGDGLTLVRNAGRSPIRLVSATTLLTNAGAPITERWPFQVVTVRSGATTGEVAGSFRLLELPATRTAPLVGSVLLPATSGNWYDIVGRWRLPAHQSAGQWRVRGVDVSYASGSQTRTVTFVQSVQLPGTGSCR